jgi:trans-2,3-dihydro-3-hydroxyanthranilate isomerase
MRRTEADDPGSDFSPGLDYHVLDVFTDTAFVGNPLAVVLGAESLSTQQLQTLAREFQLSETAFPMFGDPAVAAAGADYRLRIFTPEVELPFAGHPSVGTAWLLQTLGLVTARDGQVIQVCGAGALPLGRDEQGRVELRGGAPSLGEPVDPLSVAAAVGLRPDDLFGASPRLAGTGIDFVVAPVRGDALARAQPDLGVLRAAFPAKANDDASASSQSAAGVLIVAWDAQTSDPPRFRVRMFAGDVGVAEDAATGSAALALGVFLVDAGRLPAHGESRYVVSQGVEMGRPSVLRCRVVAADGRPAAVFVSGDVVPVATGRVRVPVVD